MKLKRHNYSLEYIATTKAGLFKYYRKKGFGIGQAMSMSGISDGNPAEYALIVKCRNFINGKKPNAALPRANDEVSNGK